MRPENEGATKGGVPPAGSTPDGGADKERVGGQSNQVNVSAFLSALFPENRPGLIEVRLIEDKKKGEVIERHWYLSRGEALDDLPRLHQIAVKRGAAIFFGVLARRAVGLGTAEDVLAGPVVWVDLDFKDFKGGEAEARQRLRGFPIAPSIVVRSGHGLHAYWLLREVAGPEMLSGLSRRLARVLGGDHAFDAARLLRLPGTYNRKDPENPILVEIESIEAERTYNESEITEALELVESGEPAKTRGPSSDQGEPTIQPDLPASVRALIQQRKRIALLFNGKGKPELGADGKPLDSSSSGYDFSLVMALAKAGLRDRSDLASALWHRPDGAAQAKGNEYITRTVANALALVESAEQEGATLAVDFDVEHLRLFNSNPARYEFRIQGIAFTVTTQQLRSPGRFAIAFMDALHRAPQVPSKTDEWTPVVNGWLKMAEIVDLPPEASYEPALAEAIQRIVLEMAVGDAAEDLDHGKAVQLPDGRRGFKVAAVLRRLQDDYAQISGGEVASMLKKLGYGSHSTTVAGVPVRVWRSDEPTPDTREEAR